MWRHDDCERELPVTYEQGRWLANELGFGDGTCNATGGADLVEEIAARDILRNIFTVDMAVHLWGVLDLSVLSRVIDELVRRHAVFRTTFHSKNGSIVQRIHSAGTVKLRAVDLRGCPNHVIEALISYEASKLMDLTLEPPLSLLLIRYGKDDHVLCASIHHIIFDGWSLRILSKEFVELYKTFACGETPVLAEPHMQYADYMLRPRQALQEPRLSRLLSYWRAKLDGMGPAPTIEFPGVVAPAAPVYSRRYISETSSPLLATKIKAMATKAKTTLFMPFVAAVALWIFVVTGQNDIGLLIPVANRNDIETESLIGWFANQVVLRVDVQGHSTLCEVLGRIRVSLIEALAHSDLPFLKLEETFHTEQHGRWYPKRSTVFVSMDQQSGLQESIKVGALQVTGFSYTPVNFICDRPAITLNLTDQPDACKVTLGYPPEWFDGDDAAEFIKGFMRVLNDVVEKPLSRITELGLTPANSCDSIGAAETSIAKAPARSSMCAPLE